MVLPDKDLFDIVFMDNQMPVMEFRKAGADIVLSKPLRLTTLQSLVRFVDAEDCKSR
eukprot:gene69629-biopygen46677